MKESRESNERERAMRDGLRRERERERERESPQREWWDKREQWDERRGWERAKRE